MTHIHNIHLSHKPNCYKNVHLCMLIRSTYVLCHVTNPVLHVYLYGYVRSLLQHLSPVLSPDHAGKIVQIPVESVQKNLPLSYQVAQMLNTRRCNGMGA